MHNAHKSQAAKGRRVLWLAAALTPLLLATGCESAAGKGLLAGGGLGALAGGAIGAATHHAGTGALIGAAAGATLGGLTGAAVDNHEQKAAIRQAAQRQAIGLQDVVSMTRNGTSDDIIINQIQTTGTVFRLTGSDVIWLQQNGVHDCVVKAMQATANLPPPVVYMNEPPPPRVVYVLEPPPPVGFGFVIHSRR
jgi:hypothetical protein